MRKQKLVIAVIGGHSCNRKTAKLTEELGREIAKLGAILVCGGLGGVMEAACKGAKKNNGQTIGIIPTYNKNDANQYVDIIIPTGLGYARNVLVVQTADIVIALPGESGTLSEIAYALQFKKLVISLADWNVSGMIKVKNLKEAVKIISALIK